MIPTYEADIEFYNTDIQIKDKQPNNILSVKRKMHVLRS